MCLIILKPVGEGIPRRRMMTGAFENNPDGLGYMLPFAGEVQISKGFSGVRSMRKNLFRFLEEKHLDPKKMPIAFHFRFATHGQETPQNAHPFPLSNRIEDLTALDIKSQVGIMHNGVIAGLEDKVLSDSQLFIRDCLSALTWSELLRTQKLIEKATEGSKFLFMDGKGSYFSTGSWLKKEGLYVSNTSYEVARLFPRYSREENKLFWNYEKEEEYYRGMDHDDRLAYYGTGWERFRI